MKGVIGIVLCCIFPVIGISQIQDSIQLHSVIVSAERTSGIPGLKSVEIDSSVIAFTQIQNLGTLLQNQSSINIKTYGSTGIQTPSFRGMSSSHTKVYVNGLDVSPGSLGQNDLSIFPVFLFSGVAIKYGNSAYTEGIGAIGGGILLETNSSSVQKFNLVTGFSLGSFGKKIANFELGFKKGKWGSVSRFVYQEAKNDFEYVNEAQRGYPIEKQTHAENSLNGFSQNFTYDVNSKNQIWAMVLGTFSKRDLPKYMTSLAESQQSQKDDIVTSQLGWKNFGEKSKSQMVMGYNWSSLNYTDSASNIYSTTVNQKIQFRENYDLNLNANWALNTRLNIEYASADNLNYTGSNQMFQTSLLAGVNGHLTSKWELGAFIQPTVSRDQFVWLPMVSLAFLPTSNKHLVIGLNVSQNAHFPTLNDLYWVPGGNPDLLPEMATNGELNVHLDKKFKKNYLFDMDVSGFYGNVDNWILWQPSNQAFWEAQNVKTVKHQGIETQIELAKNIQNWKLGISGSYQFVEATNENVSDASLGKQLIYTPKNSGNGRVSIGYKKIGLNVVYNYTGIRYLTTDNSSYLPSYNVLDLVFQYHIDWANKHRINVQIDINNVLNAEYMSVAWLPMLGINYLLSVRYTLN